MKYELRMGSSHAELPMAGVSQVLFSESYMKFGGREGINMMSMLFCRYGGGIISAKESGQGNNKFDHLTEEEMLFVATIYGEAGGCSEIAWQVIANVIMNRSMDQHWSKSADISNGATLYYSPNAQKELHDKYREKPNWDFSQLEETKIKGTENDDFLFYRYK